MVRRPPRRAQFDVATVAKAFTSLLFVVALAAAVMGVRSHGLTALPDVAASLYITGVLAAGVLLDAVDTRGWRLAFFGGLVVVGLGQYLGSSDPYDLLLVVAGAAMLVGVALDVWSD